MEITYGSYKKNVGKIKKPIENIEGVDKSIFIERFPDENNNDCYATFRIIIRSGKREITSPIFYGCLPTKSSSSFILDGGKRYDFIADDKIISCRAPHDGKKAAIKTIGLYNQGKITRLDFFKEHNAFVACFDLKKSFGNTVGYNKDFRVLHLVDKEEEPYRNLEYDKTEGVLRFTERGIIDADTECHYEGEVDCFNGRVNARVTSVGNIVDQLPSISISKKANDRENVLLRIRDAIFKFKKEKLAKYYSVSESGDIQYEIIKNKQGYLNLKAHIGGISLTYNIWCNGDLRIDRVIPAKSYYESFPCITMEPDKTRPPISYDSIFGCLVRDEEKTKYFAYEKGFYSTLIQREGVNIYINAPLDANNNITGQLCVNLFSDNVTSSKNKEGFDVEELSDVVRKHFEVLSGLVNVPLLTNPYGKSDSLEDLKERKKIRPESQSGK